MPQPWCHGDHHDLSRGTHSQGPGESIPLTPGNYGNHSLAPWEPFPQEKLCGLGSIDTQRLQGDNMALGLQKQEDVFGSSRKPSFCPWFSSVLISQHFKAQFKHPLFPEVLLLPPMSPPPAAQSRHLPSSLAPSYQLNN